MSAVAFHPELPVILTGSEDGTVRVWHANTYRLENTLNYGLERVWTMAHRRGSNNIAIGYDDGSIIIKVCSSLLRGTCHPMPCQPTISRILFLSFLPPHQARS